MKIGIVGSRRRNTEKDYQKVLLEFNKHYTKGDIIISGGCWKGADKFAERIAKEYNIPIEIYYADWKKYGKVAGFLRNTIVVEKANTLIACVAEDRQGGTEDTIKKFIKKNGNKNLYLVE
jgi:hypothetical protein